MNGTIDTSQKPLMNRRQVKARRSSPQQARMNVRSRLQEAIGNWVNALASSSDVQKTLEQFLLFRNLVAEAELAAPVLVELKYGDTILEKIKSDHKEEQITYLYALSDLVDVDRSGLLGKNFCELGMIDEVLKILRSIPSNYDFETQLKTSCICALSSLYVHAIDYANQQLDQKDFDMINKVLQMKSMMHVHARCLIFLNNIYVSCGIEFHEIIAKQMISSIMTLLMYNVTNHIKLKKQHSALFKSIGGQAAEVDPMFDDNLYPDLIESACILLGNITTSPEHCELAEKYSLIDTITLLFHNKDTTVEALTEIVKCFGNMAVLQENRQKIYESNIMPIAVRLIKMKVDDELKANLTLLFANMSGYEMCNQLLISGEVIKPMADLLDPEHEHAHRYSILALANLSVDINSIPMMMQVPEFLSRIIDMCYSPDNFLQRQATRVIYAISSYPTGAFWNDLTKAGVPEALKYVISVAGKDIDDLPVDNKFTSSLRDKSHDANKPSAPHLATQALSLLQGTALHSAHFQASKMTHAISQVQNKIFTALNIDDDVAAAGKEPDPKKALEEKDKGNEFFRKKKYKDSIICYTKAIEYDPANHTNYSNRSAAYCNLEQYELALKDAEKCVQLASNWVKGHFRKGKALIGLKQYTEAIAALKQGLKLEQNKELQDALKQATSLVQENGDSPLPFKFQKLNAVQVMEYLRQANMLKHSAHLLMQLFNLFKKYYSNDIDARSRRELIGTEGDADDIGMQLHTWSTSTDLQALMEVSGIDDLLFKTDLVAEHIKRPFDQTQDDVDIFEIDFFEDMSCYQFAFFVTTILARLVLQGHSKYGLPALKRLIALDSDKAVRDSVGSPLTQSTLQVSGVGGWGLPRMPSLRQLFIQCGGLKCIALDSNDDIVFKTSCVEFIMSLDLNEWKQRTLIDVESVFEHFVVPSLESDDKELQSKAVTVFGMLCCVNIFRENLESFGAKFEESSAFVKFVSEEFKSHPNLSAIVPGEGIEHLDLDSFYRELGETTARKWLNLPPEEKISRYFTSEHDE